MSEQDLYRFRDSHNVESLYVELFGELHRIADPATLTGVFGDNPDTNDDRPPGYKITWDINSGSFLGRNLNGIVYLVTNGHKYRIANPDTLNHYQFHGPIFPREGEERNNCEYLAGLFLNSIPEGPQITI